HADDTAHDQPRHQRGYRETQEQDRERTAKEPEPQQQPDDHGADSEAQEEEARGQYLEDAKQHAADQPDPPFLPECHYPRPFRSLNASPKASSADVGRMTVCLPCPCPTETSASTCFSATWYCAASMPFSLIAPAMVAVA